MFYYSILFSLHGPKTNLYTYLPTIQKRALEITGNLKEGSTYALICDGASAAYLRQFPSLASVQILVAPTPKRIQDGMSMRYLLPFLTDLSGQTAVYIDLDMLPLKQVAFDVADDSILVLPEGHPTDTNYCGNHPLRLPVGVTSGFFAFRDGPRIRKLFQTIVFAISSSKEDYYTVDQPHFNHALAAAPNVDFMDATLVSFNGHTNQGVASWINLCGDPGDGPLHFQKVLEFFSSAYTRR